MLLGLSCRRAEYNFVSSAYMAIIDCSCDGISFTYKVNRMGPRMLPWGIPDNTGFQLDMLSLTLTLYLLSVRKDLIQYRALSSIPKDFTCRISL